MKTIAVLAMISGLLILSGAAYADQYGAPEPTAKEGGFALTMGHTFYDSKWESSDFANSIRVFQSRAFVQGSYSFMKNWEGYVRGGVADFRSKDFYDDANGGLFGATGFGDFREGYQPYAAAGIKGLVYSDGIFAFGPFAQGTYQFADYKSDVFLNSANYVEFKFKNPWDVTVGIAGQVKVMGLTLYGGPFGYWTGAKVEARGVSGGVPESGSARPEEKGNIGGFFGVKGPLFIKNLSINAEVQLKSEISTGASLTYSF
jgi:hypothetical protein